MEQCCQVAVLNKKEFVVRTGGYLISLKVAEFIEESIKSDLMGGGGHRQTVRDDNCLPSEYE